MSLLLMIKDDQDADWMEQRGSCITQKGFLLFSGLSFVQGYLFLLTQNK